jgi:hypothetical protein
MTPEEMSREIAAIQERNIRVELDKAWEVSWTRRLFIAVSTYIIAGIWLVLIHEKFPGLKSFVPAIGYVLSTMTVPVLKRWWTNKNHV